MASLEDILISYKDDIREKKFTIQKQNKTIKTLKVMALTELIILSCLLGYAAVQHIENKNMLEVLSNDDRIPFDIRKNYISNRGE